MSIGYVSEVRKLRCKKECGTWYYQKFSGGDLDVPVYNLYDGKGDFVAEFGCFGDMKYYIETGTILC